MNISASEQHSFSHEWPRINEVERMSMLNEVGQIYGLEQIAFSSDLVDIVSVLAETDADQDMVTVSILRAMQTENGANAERIGKKFGATVRDLYEGALQLDRMSLIFGRDEVRAASGNGEIDLSRILVAMVDDPRVVVVHLAEHLVQMRAAKHFSESDRNTMAEQTMSVYTPLANKLGIWRLKWELEDLSFKYLNRTEFDHLARQLDERRAGREDYIRRFVELLQKLMTKSNIDAVVYGRAKHIYGIWRKLNRKGVNIENIFDVRAVRILVDDVSSCYASLGAVHASWPSIPSEFDDYISVPKANGYQSLHTAVTGPNSKIVEVQIRTNQMHNDCELGVAAHWKYKEGVHSVSYQDDKVTLLRRILEWKDEISGTIGERSVQDESVAKQEIYVFTPAGNVVELPVCATPVDFAYAVHTEVGHRCRGAKVNEKIVPLTHQLKTGDWVEIRTVKSGGPSRDWLNPHQGFTVTSRAQSRIRRWFKQEEYGRYFAQGKALLEKEFNRHGLRKVNLERLAVDNGFRQSQELLTAIGMKELKPAHAVSGLVEVSPSTEIELEVEIKTNRPSEERSSSLSILGVTNLLTNHASCCGPLPGDDVVGYVTVSRGITIHKRDCGNIRRMLEVNPDRMVAVDWEYDKSAKYAVVIELVAEGRATLLQETTAVTAELGVSLTAVNTSRLRKSELGRVLLTVEVGGADELKKVLTKLRQVDGVLKSRRISD